MTAVPSTGLAGLVLAGGEGSRYGRPKAWARLPDGTSFLERCTACLVGGGAAPVWATLPPDSRPPEIDGLESVVLPRSGLDMFGSLRFGIERLLPDTAWNAVAVLPVDHPLVRPDSVAALADYAASAAVPTHRGKRGHPAVIARDVAEGVACGRIDGPTLRGVLADLEVVEVPVDDPGVIANCNTPEALERALVSGEQVR